MSVKPPIKSAEIRIKIDLDNVSQVEHLCRKLNCSPLELRKVVLERGPSMIDLVAHRPIRL